MRILATTLMTLAATLATTAAPASACDDPPPVVVRRTVTVVRTAPAPRRVWVPERWETRVERVVVREGYWREVVEPAQWSVRFDLRCRRMVRVCIRPETVRREWVAPRYGERTVQVLIPGYWTYV